MTAPLHIKDIGQDLKSAIAAAAEQQGKTMSEVVITALRMQFDVPKRKLGALAGKYTVSDEDLMAPIPEALASADAPIEPK